MRNELKHHVVNGLACVLVLSVVLYLLKCLYFDVNWKRFVADQGFNFGPSCEAAVGSAQDGSKFADLFSQPLQLTPWSLPFPTSLKYPNVEKNGFFKARCTIPVKNKADAPGYLWVFAGYPRGETAVYIDDELIGVWEHRSHLDFPVPARYLQPSKNEISLTFISKEFKGVVGFMHQAPLVAVYDHQARWQVMGVKSFFLNERPAFFFGLYALLAIIFVISWFLGIRNPSMGWLIISLSLGAVFYLTEFGSMTKTIPEFLRIILKGSQAIGSLSLIMFFNSYLTGFSESPKKFIGFLFASMIVILAGFLPSSLRNAIFYDQILLPLALFISMCAMVYRARHQLRNGVSSSKTRNRVFNTVLVASLFLLLLSPVFQLTLNINLSVYARSIMSLMAAAFLGADLVVFERKMIEEKAAREKEEEQRLKLEERLELGKSVQTLLFPKSSKGRTESVGWNFFHKPAHQMSGDWYAEIENADGSRILMIGDIVGKGPSAAIVTSVLFSAIQEVKGKNLPVEGILMLMHKRLFSLFGGHMNTTVQVVEVKEGDVTVWVQGGQSFVHYVGRKSKLIGRSGGPLGGVATPSFFPENVTIEPGEKLFAFTDGVLETARAMKKYFRHIGQKLHTPTDEELYQEACEVGESVVHDDDRTMIVVSNLQEKVAAAQDSEFTQAS